LEGGEKLISVEEIRLEGREGLTIQPPEAPLTGPAPEVSLLSLSAVISAYAGEEIEPAGTVTSASPSEKK
jgi:hypothetical protein